MTIFFRMVNPTLFAAWQAIRLSLVSNTGTIMPAIQHFLSFPFLRDLFIGGLLLSFIGSGIVVGIAWYITKMLTHPKKKDQFLPLTPYALGLPAEVISFPCVGRAHQVRGLYIPVPGARSTILICPGYRRSLSDILVTCKHLWEAGHNVLAFEFYGHGLPVGSIVTLGYREIDDFLGAVTYATFRAPTSRLGAIGFSMGAATAIMAVARTKKVEALVADSGFATQWNAIEMAVRRTLRVPLPAWSIRVLYRVTDILLWLRAGYHLSQVEPIREIGQIAPRPLLLIHGLQDTIINPRDATHLYEAAAEPKELWLIPKCEHIRGYFLDSVAYVAKVTAFFEPLKIQTSSKMFSLPFFPQQGSSLIRALPHTDELLTDIHSTELLTGERESFISTKTGISKMLEYQTQSVMQEERYHLMRHTEPLPRHADKPSLRQGKRDELRKQRLIRSVHLRYAHFKTNTTRQIHKFSVSYSHLVYRSRWLIIVLWIGAFAISLPFAGSLTNILHNSGYVINGSESNRVDRILSEKLHQPVSQVLVLFQSNTTAVSAPSYQQEVQRFLSQVRTLPSVTNIIQAGVGLDGRTTYVSIGFNADQDTVSQHLPALRTLLPKSPDNPARAMVTGDPAITNEIQVDTQTDTEHAESIALPLTLLVLVLVFGSVIAGLMPLALAAVTVPVTLAIIYAVAAHVETNIFVFNIASIIGLGLSIDYSLFIIRRFREELAQGKNVRDTIALTVATAGESVLFSGLTVIVGFSGLFFVGIPVMASFALGGITVAATAVLAALTLLPALLCIVGPRINTLRIPLSRVVSVFQTRVMIWQHQKHQSFWHAWAIIVMRRPVMMIVLITAILVGLGWPALSLNPGLPGASALPLHSEARQSLDVLKTQFPNVNVEPIFVIAQTLDGSNMLTEHNLNVLQSLSQRIGTLHHVASVTDLFALPETSSPLTFTDQQLLHLYSSGAYQHFPQLAQMVMASTKGDTTIITIRSDANSDSQPLINNVRDLNQQPDLGIKLLVGGSQATTLDFDHVLYGNFLRALLFILIVTYVLLLIMFRSVILPLKAIVMNVLSISVAYGTLVYIFQQGHFQKILNFSSDGSIDRFIPVLLFCVLFGLSMDYEVFLLSRIQEEWRNTGENSTAVAYGLEHTGGIITNAALLFIIVSASFITTSLVVVKELGFGITVAVLVDASIIRSVLVPATMQVLGRWNWWFPRKRKEQQQIMVQELPIHHKRLGRKVRITRRNDLRTNSATPEREMIRIEGKKGYPQEDLDLLKRAQPTDQTLLRERQWPIASDSPFFYPSYLDRQPTRPLFQEDFSGLFEA